MADFITTYTGLHFYPTDPNPDDIRIEDIAHALSLICRGNGHVRTFFSVGQHCVNCTKEAIARGCGNRIALAMLLHDASECYMSDVPRPFKKFLKDYCEQENRLLDLIYEKYLGSGITEEEQKIMKCIDDDMLYYDLKELLGWPAADKEPELLTKISYEVRPFAETEEEYLELFRVLTQQ